MCLEVKAGSLSRLQYRTFTFSNSGSFQPPPRPRLRRWHSKGLFSFTTAATVLVLALSTEPLLWFSAAAQEREKRPRKWRATYSSHFAKRHSSVDRVVSENDRERHAPVRNASSSVAQFSGSRLRSHVLSSFQTRKTGSIWHLRQELKGVASEERKGKMVQQWRTRVALSEDWSFVSSI